MKVLIVDDEQHVRAAIRLLADWKGLGVEEIYEADNGLEAAELIDRIEPEILITDMRMPLQDGVKLLQHAQEKNPSMQKIVVSGHNDFELVRSTMKYGGQDYLLKPINPEQLTEALRKAVENWHRADMERRVNQKRSMEINQIKPVYWDKLMSGLVADSPEYPSCIRSMLEEEFGEGIAEECRVAVLSLDSAGRAIMKRFNHNRDLLFFSLTNICNEFLRPGNRGLACRYWNSDREILLIAWSRTDEFSGLLHEINDGILHTLGSRLDIGVGGAKPFPAGAAESCRQARRALQQRNMREKEHWIHEGEGRPCPAKELHLADFEESLRVSLLCGSSEEIAKAVDGWLSAVGELACITWKQIDEWRKEWDSLMRRLGRRTEEEEQEGDGETGSFLSKPVPVDQDGCLSLSEWGRQVRESFEQLARKHNQSHREKGSMRDIARYLEENYNRELTLQDIAGHFYLSREYISRRFKQEFGENLSDYLGRIRIGKAKLLLQNPNLRIAQIAEMVGYPDEKYFSKVFKKLEGKSPSEYRHSGFVGF